MLYDKKWETPTKAPTKIEPWRQVLLDAADLIEKRGWARNHYVDPYTGALCAIGAITRAGENRFFWTKMRARRALRKQIGYLLITGWNDSLASPGEVPEKMRAAARR